MQMPVCRLQVQIKSFDVNPGCRLVKSKRKFVPDFFKNPVFSFQSRTFEAYFPPTFEKDGFTHATAVPSRLLDVANHFYQDVPGEWMCLRFRRSALLRLDLWQRSDFKTSTVKQSNDQTVKHKQSDWCQCVSGKRYDPRASSPEMSRTVSSTSQTTSGFAPFSTSN